MGLFLETFPETVERPRKPRDSERFTISDVLSMKPGSATPRLIWVVAICVSMGDNQTSTRLAVDQPTRGADRNRSLADQADPATNELLLPSLDDGITLLDVEGGRGVPILQSLVLDHLLLHEGPAFWVDANGHATTTTLAQIAPSQRLLDRIQVARGFTAYQHYGAVCDLSTAVNQSIQSTAVDTWTPAHRSGGNNGDSSPHTPSLIVAPAVDAQYRSDDTLRQGQAATLQARTLALLATYADGYDVPVLVTRSTVDEFTEPVATAADHHLECQQTRMGPRFVGDDFETLVYPVDDGAYYQTTFAYWQQLLTARATQVGLEPSSPTSTAETTDVGTATTDDGETTSIATGPLLDAWTATSTGGH